jgi:hypothetical protein
MNWGIFKFLPDASTYVCILHPNWIDTVLYPLGGGLVGGLVLALLSVYGERGLKHHTSDEKKEQWNKEFYPGAKLWAAQKEIQSENTQTWVFLYRLFQVIANAWFPMVILIFVSPWVTIPCYALLYAVPGFLRAGVELFRQPIYLLTPADLSLFGIDHAQDPKGIKFFLVSSIRPYIFMLLLLMIAVIGKEVMPPTSEMFWNGQGIFRIRMMSPPGPYVLNFVMGVTCIGVLLHTLMTWQLLYWTSRGDSTITLIKRETKAQNIRASSKCLAKGLDEIAEGWKSDDEDVSDDEMNARSDVSDVFDQAAKYFNTQEVDVLDETAASHCDCSLPLKFKMLLTIVIAVCDLIFYFYKIFAFIKGGSVFLASLIVVALSEAGFTLCFTGTFWRLPHAIRRTLRSGIPTSDFLAWTNWDDGLAGVPYLMVTTIYALTLQNLGSWLYAIIAIVCTCTGTKAMASFIMAIVDYDIMNANAE